MAKKPALDGRSWPMVFPSTLWPWNYPKRKIPFSDVGVKHHDPASCLKGDFIIDGTNVELV
ncbi:hypothetical protein [Paenibacillus lactis]|uniref:hypothetical protein n=1 Tax=Paenibacillus lactis TaxID=228574 RepID=UPI0011A2AD0C